MKKLYMIAMFLCIAVFFLMLGTKFLNSNVNKCKNTEIISTWSPGGTPIFNVNITCPYLKNITFQQARQAYKLPIITIRGQRTLTCPYNMLIDDVIANNSLMLNHFYINCDLASLVYNYRGNNLKRCNFKNCRRYQNILKYPLFNDRIENSRILRINNI